MNKVIRYHPTHGEVMIDLEDLHNPMATVDSFDWSYAYGCRRPHLKLPPNRKGLIPIVIQTRMLSEIPPPPKGPRKKLSKESLIKSLQDLAKSLGRTPTKLEMVPGYISYVRRFGSIRNAQIAARLKARKPGEVLVRPEWMISKNIRFPTSEAQ